MAAYVRGEHDGGLASTRTVGVARTAHTRTRDLLARAHLSYSHRKGGLSGAMMLRMLLVFSCDVQLRTLPRRREKIIRKIKANRKKSTKYLVHQTSAIHQTSTQTRPGLQQTRYPKAPRI